MARFIFADTFYWVALLNSRDNYHAEVKQFSLTLANATVVTTDEVLIEVLNFLSGSGMNVRRKAAMIVRQLLQADPQKVTVLPQSHDVFLEGLSLYEERLDKGYSLTDCISMVVMRELQIQEVLTHDHHFVQEGFQILFATGN